LRVCVCVLVCVCVCVWRVCGSTEGASRGMHKAVGRGCILKE